MGVLGLSRKQKQDVFVADPVDVMQIDMVSPVSQVRLFRDIEAEFPDLTYYDADVTIGTRYMARHGVFPLALCELEVDENQLIQSIRPLNTRWDLIPDLPPLRIFELKPDCDPNRGKVHSLLMRTDRFAQHIPLDPAGEYLRLINEALATYDPDIFVTDWGDSWLIPFLNAQSAEKGIPCSSTAMARGQSAGRKKQPTSPMDTSSTARKKPTSSVAAMWTASLP